MSDFVLLHGDCLEQLGQVGDGEIDSVVTDPPYELGFMGKSWDATGIANNVAMWREVLRVLKPGGHLVAFGGSRTYHRMACAIEDAGFEIRDSLQWLYGTGFPKSMDVGKAIDNAAGAKRDVLGVRGSYRPAANAARDPQGFQDRSDGAITAPTTEAAKRWEGWGTALKPAYEPIVLARKPLIGTVAANVQSHGTGALNIDGCRIATGSEADRTHRQSAWSNHAESKTFHGGKYKDLSAVEAPEGRWPANVLLDEDAAAILDTQSGVTKDGVAVQRNGGGQKIGGTVAYQGSSGLVRPDAGYGGGGASRFYYCAKAGKGEREAGLEHMPKKSGAELTDSKEGQARLDSPRTGAGRGGGRANHHPTVKPISLMRYLVRLITPPGGVVLDPFTGSGTTGIAAIQEGFDFIGIEKEDEYVEIARARIEHWKERQRG